MKIKQDIIERDVVKDIRKIPKSYKKSFIELLDAMKIDFLYRTTKSIGDVKHIIYRNWWLATISEIRKAIETIGNEEENKIWEVTRDIY